MLCVAKVTLQEWPEGTLREVDPQNERTIGLLRGGYIAPVRLPRRPAPEQPAEPSLTPVEAAAPDAAAKPASALQVAPTRKAAKKPRAEDE